MNVLKNVTVVDLFCGVGGLTYGLKKAGLNVVAGYDFDESCKFAYEHNNNAKFYHEDIHQVDASAVLKLFGNSSIKVLVGCAPCQPFSNHSNKTRKLKNNDSRWNLLNEFLRIIKEVSPDIISMENVPQLAKFEIFTNFVIQLKDLGYHVDTSIVFCPDYGLAQSRKRLVLLAAKNREIKLKDKTHSKYNYVTLKQAIGFLEPINAGASSINDDLHKSSTLSEMNLKRIQASKPNGTWRDWSPHLLPECYKKDSGKTFSCVYGRMSWDKPAPTITTQFYSYGTGRFGHPEQDRALSLREAAILQGFPSTYRFHQDDDKIVIRRIARQIGNAVPVTLGFVVGESIIAFLNEFKG